MNRVFNIISCIILHTSLTHCSQDFQNKTTMNTINIKMGFIEAHTKKFFTLYYNNIDVCENVEQLNEEEIKQTVNRLELIISHSSELKNILNNLRQQTTIK